MKTCIQLLTYETLKNQRLIPGAVCSYLIYLLMLGGLPRVCPADDGLMLSGLALTPQSRVVPGQVIVLMAKAANTGEQPVQGTVVLTIEEVPNLQSARHVVLEPGQIEQYELFMPLPQQLTQFEKVHLVATMFIRDGERDVILERNGVPAVSTLSLPVTQGNMFGMALEPGQPLLPTWYWPPVPPQSSYELATGARIDAGGKRNSATFELQSLPLNQVQWNGLELFVIAEPSPLEDPAVVQAMCQFMARGGKLWVMLDKVPCELIRPLLSAGQSCEVVERVELSDFIIDIDEGFGTRLSEEDRHLSFERDLPMVRVLQSGGRVTHRIDGWPVAVTMDIGYGQLLVTTLDSFAWVVPRTEQRGTDPYLQSDFQTRLWALNLAVSANEQRPVLPVSNSVDYPLRLIGNPVVPKTWVATALLGFCGVLAGLGLVLAYARRLPVLGLIAPGVALVASLGLLLAATWVRRDIPESVSQLQLVDIGEDGSVALIREQAAVYLSAAADMQLSSNVNGIMRSSEAVTSGVRRLVIEDFQKWHVGNANWPPGVWRYDAEFALPTSGLLVRGQLTDQGLELQLPTGLPSTLQDPVLSFVAGDPQLCDVSGTGLRVNNQIKLDGENWIAGSLISDEQQRRIEVYQKFFEPDSMLRRPSRRLYGWTTPWPVAAWSRDLKPQGSALVALPIRLQRPAIGQNVFVPHGLIQLRRADLQISLTSAFNDQTGKWREGVSMATQAAMQLVLPIEVVPLAVNAIDFELDVTAPQRTVTIEVLTEAGPIELVKLVSPSIPWSQTVTDPAILQAFQNGVLQVNVNVSDLNSAEGKLGATSMVMWQVDHFYASVRGQVLANSSLSKNR